MTVVDNSDLISHQSDLSIFAQIPQYVLMGVAEFFGTIASYEYAYYAAPRSGQTLFMSLHFCSIGISSFIDYAYIAVFPSLHDDLNFDVSDRIIL